MVVSFFLDEYRIEVAPLYITISRHIYIINCKYIYIYICLCSSMFNTCFFSAISLYQPQEKESQSKYTNKTMSMAADSSEDEPVGHSNSHINYFRCPKSALVGLSSMVRASVLREWKFAWRWVLYVS